MKRELSISTANLPAPDPRRTAAVPPRSATPLRPEPARHVALAIGAVQRKEAPVARGMAPHVAAALGSSRLPAKPTLAAALPPPPIQAKKAPHAFPPLAGQRARPPASRVVQRMEMEDDSPPIEPKVTFAREVPVVPWYWMDEWKEINYAGYRIPVFQEIAGARIALDTLIGGYSLVSGPTRSAENLVTEARRVGGVYSPNQKQGKTKAHSHVERQLFADMKAMLTAHIAAIQGRGWVAHALVIEIKQWLLPCGGDLGCGKFVANYEPYLGDVVSSFSSVYVRASSEQSSYSNTSAWGPAVGNRGKGPRPPWDDDREFEGEGGIFHVRPRTFY